MATLEETEQVHRYALQEYQELVEAGAFEDQRVELIHGLVLDMSPKSPQHDNVVEWLGDWLSARIDRGLFRVRTALSVQSEDSQPEPDVAVVDRDRPKDSHPERAHLVIEVAHRSHRRDLVVKPEIYAEGATEYWVINLRDREVVVHREPGPRGYRHTKVYDAEASIAPQSLGIEPMPFAELFAAA